MDLGSSTRRNDTAAPARSAAGDRTRPGPGIFLLAGLEPTLSVRTELGEESSRLRFEPHLIPPCAASILRVEAGAGWALNDPTVMSTYWHRPPYVMPIELVQYESQSAIRQVIDRAVISTRGARTEFRQAADRVAALLVRDMLRDTSRGGWDADEGGLWRIGSARGRGGWLDRFRTRLRDRTHAEWWSIGSTDRRLEDLVRAGGGEAVDPAPVTWLHPRFGRDYVADPFPWPGTAKLLVEEMPVRGGKGRIASLDPSRPAGQQIEPILETGQHHSYPCTFHEHGAVYCLPEATRRGTTILYSLSLDGQLTPVQTIAEGRRLADSTLFRHQGRYWIACTDLDFGEHDNLCLLHADRLDGRWQPHRQWPVRIDIRGARPAGSVFTVDGRLYRPGQDCAATYGAGVMIHRINELTPYSFQETLVSVVRPDPGGPFPHGLHTIVDDGERVWIDGKRFVFDPVGLGQKILRKLGLRRDAAA